MTCCGRRGTMRQRAGGSCAWSCSGRRHARRCLCGRRGVRMVTTPSSRRLPPPWKFGARWVLWFRYQIGAADMRAELHGIGADEVATRLGEIEGSLIELLGVTNPGHSIIG